MTLPWLSSGDHSPLAALVIALVLAFGSAPSFAEGPSTDDELLESLDSELLDGLETIPADDEPTAPGNVPTPGAVSEDMDEFTRIGQQMRKLEYMLPKLEQKSSTTRLQKEVVDELEKLIADLEKQSQQNQQEGSSGRQQSQQTADREQVKQPDRQASSNGQQNPNKPAQDSTERLGKDEIRQADMEQMQGLLKDVWGQLPAKAREQMLQSSPEQFLPKYELLIEDYYRKLAEKKPQ